VHVNITAVAAVSIIAYDIFSGHQTDSSSQRVERDIEEKDSKKGEYIQTAINRERISVSGGQNKKVPSYKDRSAFISSYYQYN
jgi:hypothetical protein